MIAGERRLWRAVVLQAIEDIYAVNYRDQRAAIKWIFCNSEDFRMVCELAGVAPRWVRQKAFEKIITGRDAKIDTAIIMKKLR